MADHLARRSDRRRPSRRGSTATSHRGRRRSLPRLVIALGVAAIVAVATTAIGGTFALWSDTSTVNSGSLTSGKMDLQLVAGTSGTQAVGIGTGFTASSIAFTDYSPGESIAVPVTVSNVGNPRFTWTVTVTQGTSWTFVNTPITAQLFAGGTAATTGSYPKTGTCNGGTAQTTAQTITAGSTALTGAARPLAAGSSDAMCLIVGMASTADSQNQGKTGTLSFTFTANQVIP